MKLAAALLFLACAASVPAADDGFAKWWSEFQASTARNDAKAFVKGIQYPIDWELGKVRKISTEADFIAHYNAYVPADMRKAIATQKPVLLPSGVYLIIWHARGDEYSLHFILHGETWSLFALAEGPI